MEKKNLITKRNVVLLIVALIVLVFIANILMAYIILPASYYQDLPPGAPPLPQPTFSEILLISITNPLVLILAMGGGLWLILSALGKKETARPDRLLLQKDLPVVGRPKEETAITDRYRIYLTFILTLFALLSIQLLSINKHNSIIPPIIMISAVTFFVAVTTYLRRYYPYAAIFASLLLGAVYLAALPLPALPYITYVPQIGVAIEPFSIPIFVIASAWWRSEKMGVVYPVAYSLVSGIVVAGWWLLPIGSGWEPLGLLSLYFFLTFLSGILTVISFLTKSRYEFANKYFIPSLKGTLSLIVFLITILVTIYIFQPYYYPHGLSD